MSILQEKPHYRPSARWSLYYGHKSVSQGIVASKQIHVIQLIGQSESFTEKRTNQAHSLSRKSGFSFFLLKIYFSPHEDLVETCQVF